MRMPSMQFELKIMAGGIYLGLYARQDHGVNGQLSRIRGLGMPAFVTALCPEPKWALDSGQLPNLG